MVWKESQTISRSRDEGSLLSSKKSRRNRKKAVHLVGGIMFVIAPAWGPSQITCQDDYSECGALSSMTLQTTTGRLNVIGTYWPIRHTMDETTLGDQNLWSRVAGFLHENELRETPIDYIKRLIITLANTAMASGSHAIIIGGDLNATWEATESGGQRVLSTWAHDNALSNGPRMLAAHRNDAHITRPVSYTHLTLPTNREV